MMHATASILVGELRHYQRWMPFTLLVVANILPLLIFAALKPLDVDLSSPDLFILPSALIPYTAFIIGLAVVVAQGPVSRLYLKPLTNVQITSLFFFTGAVLTGLGIAVSITLWNLLFELQWSVIGPALLGVGFWSAVHPSLRISAASPIRVLEAIAVVLLLWYATFHLRMLAFAGSQQATWSSFFSNDIAPFLLFVIGGYWLSVRRVAADRCGNGVSRVVDLFRSLQVRWDKRRIETRTISWDPPATYARLEWHVRGMPFLFTMVVLYVLIAMGCVIAVLCSPQTVSRTLIDIASGLPSLLLLHAVVAGLFGFLTPFFNDESIPSQNSIELDEVKQQTGMGEFRACLPISDSAMATAAIWSIGKCLLISLGLLITFSALVIWLAGWSNVNGELQPSMQGKLPALAIIGVTASWAAMSGGTALGYFSIRHSKLPLILVGVFTGLMMLPTITARIAPAVLLVSLAIVVYQFASAYRKRLLSAKQMIASGTVLALIAFGGGLILASSLDMSAYLLWCLLPLAAIWPVASLPLAIQACRRG